MKRSRYGSVACFNNKVTVCPECQFASVKEVTMTFETTSWTFSGWMCLQCRSIGPQPVQRTHVADWLGCAWCAGEPGKNLTRWQLMRYWVQTRRGKPEGSRSI